MTDQSFYEIEEPDQDSSDDLNMVPRMFNETNKDKANNELALRGKALTKEFVPAYLRYFYPKFPEEGIQKLNDWLLEDQKIYDIAKATGLFDVLNSKQFPPHRWCWVSRILRIYWRNRIGLESVEGWAICDRFYINLARLDRTLTLFIMFEIQYLLWMQFVQSKV